MIIPRPTAASAAATTITNSTKTCPSNLPSAWLNATNARFTAFSISSMDMKIVMMLRLKIRSEEHTSELQSHLNLVCRLLLEKKMYLVDRDDHLLKRISAGQEQCVVIFRT